MGKRKFLLNSLVGWFLLGAVIKMVFDRRGKERTSTKVYPQKNEYLAIDDYIRSRIKKYMVPGAVIAVVGSKGIVYTRGYGRANDDDEIPSEKTPFFIGSLTKSFTAFAIMQLVEKGKINLDDRVQKYLPWFKVRDNHASSMIKIRHLLNQTSGLPALPGMANLANFDNHPDALTQQVKNLSSIKLSHPVGSKFEYSNLNYNVLGLIIEIVSGKTYSEYVKQNILNPLHMDHTYFSKTVANQNGLALGHRYWFGNPIPVYNLKSPLGSLPSGQIISCAEDMSHYLLVYLNKGRYLDKHVLSETSIEAMHQPGAEIKEMGMDFGHYGMGWVIEGKSKPKIVSHSGIVPDFGAYMALIPGQKKGLILLFNVNHPLMKLTFDEMGTHATRILTGMPPAPSRLGFMPWVMRCMPLFFMIPVYDAFITSRFLYLWDRGLVKFPCNREFFRQHILLPLIPNFAVLSAFISTLGKNRGWMNVFMPDFTYGAKVSGYLDMFWLIFRNFLLFIFYNKYLKPSCISKNQIRG